MEKLNLQDEQEKKVILIVDDMEINRAILRLSFENEYEIIEANNGEKALEVLGRQHVDLLITDIFMDKMDGYELIERVRADQRLKQLPIIAVTEHDDAVLQKAIELGVDEFICKPFVDHTLRSCVNGVLYDNRMQAKIEQFHQVFDKNPMPFMLYHLLRDASGEYTSYEIAYANQAAADLVDVELENLKKSMGERVSEERMSFLLQAHEEDAKVQDIFFEPFCKKYIDIVAYRESEGYIAFVMKDVTMQHKAEQAIIAEMKYLQAAQDEDLLGKCRVNLTKNIVDNYSGVENLIFSTETSKYTDTVENVAAVCVTEQMAERLREQMMPENLLAAFSMGNNKVASVYLRNMSDGRILWVRTVVKIYQDPESKDIMSFMYTYDIDSAKTLQLIVDHVAETEYEMLGLLYPKKDRLHCVKTSEMENKIHDSVNIVYSEGFHTFSEVYIEEEKRDEVRNLFSIEHIQNVLKEKEDYALMYPVVYEGGIHQKKWKFSYLDSSHEIIVLTRTDVTEMFKQQEVQRENLRNALLQAEHASHAKTDFLSHMSHEIRTPMNAIIGMSALAAQCVNDPAQVSECISKIGISARFLLSLINDILDMSRIESGKVVLKAEKFPFEDMIASINSIIYNQAKDKGIDYECVVTGFTSTYYMGDATKLQQVLLNLLGNAVKFTQSGGKVQFMVHKIKEENGQAYLTFTINDTGIGISEKFQKMMFEPFEQENNDITTVYQGTGLGLAICKNLIDMMNGTIAVNSIEGIGTEFTVNIALGVCEEEQKFSATSAIPFEKICTLIVDDDVVVCEHTQGILREMGMRAEWVSSGRQAISIVREKAYRNKYYDIVLLDWKMPDMDGIETARRLRQIVGADVTIIVITAYDWSEIEAEAKAAGVNLLVTKPLFKSTLMSVFQKVYNEKAQEEYEEEKKEYDFTGKQILLVEDHILNIEVAKRLLESKNAKVEVAENGLRAIEMFAKSSSDYYDIILMDVRMPVMDGLTAARSIRQMSNANASTIPIIAMSANAFDEDVEKSQAAGMNAHLAKPIEPQLLFATLDKYFES